MSQQPQSWGVGAEAHAITSINVLQSVTSKLNLPHFRSKWLPRVSAVILELVGPIARSPSFRNSSGVSLRLVFRAVRLNGTVLDLLSEAVLDDCFLKSYEQFVHTILTFPSLHKVPDPV